jgi:hypothetical protein
MKLWFIVILFFANCEQHATVKAAQSGTFNSGRKGHIESGLVYY